MLNCKFVYLYFNFYFRNEHNGPMFNITVTISEPINFKSISTTIVGEHC